MTKEFKARLDNCMKAFTSQSIDMIRYVIVVGCVNSNAFYSHGCYILAGFVGYIKTEEIIDPSDRPNYVVVFVKVSEQFGLK